MVRPPNQLEVYRVAELEQFLIGWRRRHERLFSAETSHEIFETFFLERLHANTKSIDAVYIVDLARRGHPAADRALRRFIIEANEEDRFQALPLSVRAYNSELLLRAPSPPGYPSQVPQTINNFNRDCTVGWLIGLVKERYPRCRCCIPRSAGARPRTSSAACSGFRRCRRSGSSGPTRGR
jgi:hypothetical protein